MNTPHATTRHRRNSSERFLRTTPRFAEGRGLRYAWTTICAALVLCSTTSCSTVDSPGAPGGIETTEPKDAAARTQEALLPRGNSDDSFGGATVPVPTSDPIHPATPGAQSPENPLKSLMDFAREGGGERAGFGEPIVGVYPLSLQLVKPTWGAVIVGERGSVGVATDVRPEGRTIFRLSASPECGSLSLDGSRLAVSFGTTVDIYHLLTGERVERFDRSRGRITALDWAPDGESLLIGAADGKVYRWRFDRGVAELPPTEWSRRFERYVGHSTTIGAVRYHPLGRVFFSGDWDGGLSAWRDYEADGEVGLFERDPLGGEFYTRRTERISVQRPGGGEGIDALGVDRVGQRLVAGRQDGSFDVWGLRGMKHLVTQPLAGGAIYDLQVSPAGDTVATASRDGRVRVFRLTAPPTGPEIKQIAEREHPGARRLAFTSNGTLLLGDKSGKVVVVREGIF